MLFRSGPLHLRERLDLLVFSYEARALKPEPAIFERALKRAECPAAEALFVGDGANRELARRIVAVPDAQIFP